MPGSTNRIGKGKGKGKGKGLETSLWTTREATTPYARLPPNPSPTWDIELDLDAEGLPESGPPAVSRQSKSTEIQFVESDSAPSTRLPSPTWDIELDLNGSDEGHQPGGFGTAALL